MPAARPLPTRSIFSPRMTSPEPAPLQRLRASGAALHFTHTKARTIAALPFLIARHWRPYLLPSGGSSRVGALGYVEAAYELAEQVRSGELPEPAYVVTALGSGG